MKVIAICIGGITVLVIMVIIVLCVYGMILDSKAIDAYNDMVHEYNEKLLLLRIRQNANPWHDGNESPENKTHVLAFRDGRYVVMFYRDAMFEDEHDYYLVNRVDRWMYIPGNTK